MSDWNIPESVADFFAIGEAQYWIKDHEHPGDNIFGMQLFLSSFEMPAEMIEVDDGTQVVVCDGNKRLVIDSGGLGDFHLHGYDVTLHENQPAPQEPQP